MSICILYTIYTNIYKGQIISTKHKLTISVDLCNNFARDTDMEFLESQKELYPDMNASYDKLGDLFSKK